MKKIVTLLVLAISLSLAPAVLAYGAQPVDWWHWHHHHDGGGGGGHRHHWWNRH